MSPRERWQEQVSIYDELKAGLPLHFTTDKTCTWWPDRWNGVVYTTACLVHDYLYNEARIHQKYHKLGKARSDKILAYGVAREFKIQADQYRKYADALEKEGKWFKSKFKRMKARMLENSVMPWVMLKGLTLFGWRAWRKNGRRMRKKYPVQWAKYQGAADY